MVSLLIWSAYGIKLISRIIIQQRKFNSYFNFSYCRYGRGLLNRSRVLHAVFNISINIALI